MKNYLFGTEFLRRVTCASTRKALLGAMMFFPVVTLAQGESNQYDETGNQATFYVAPSGSDMNEGTFVAPFKTLARAQKEVRKVNETMTGDVVVYLRGAPISWPVR